jgi:hypothetical protein
MSAVNTLPKRDQAASITSLNMLRSTAKPRSRPISATLSAQPTPKPMVKTTSLALPKCNGHSFRARAEYNKQKP